METNLDRLHTTALGIVFIVKNEETLYTIGPIKKSLDELESKTREVDDKIPELMLPRFPKKEAHVKIKDSLSESIQFTANKIFAYAKDVQNDQLLMLARRGRANLSRLSQKEMEKLAADFVRETTPLKEVLATFMYKEEHFNTLCQLADEYDASNTDRALHSLRYTVSLGQIREYEAFYKDRIDRVTGLLTGLSHEYPMVYQNVNNLVSRPKPVKPSAILANITDEEGQPLTSAKMHLYRDDDNSLYKAYKDTKLLPDPLKATPQVVKSTTSNGMFLVRTLEAGNYTAFISMYGYERQMLNIYINPKNTFTLKITLKKVEMPPVEG